MCCVCHSHFAWAARQVAAPDPRLPICAQRVYAAQGGRREAGRLHRLQLGIAAVLAWPEAGHETSEYIYMCVILYCVFGMF